MQRFGGGHVLPSEVVTSVRTGEPARAYRVSRPLFSKTGLLRGGDGKPPRLGLVIPN
jgi:hypothetical protein